MIVTDIRVAQFVQDAFGDPFPPPYTCLGIERGGRIVAGAILNHYEFTDIHVSAAGRGWNLPFMRALGKYVYGQLGCERMTFVTERSDVIDYVQRMGGQIEGRMRNHFGPGRDATLLGVLREEYRYGK